MSTHSQRRKIHEESYPLRSFKTRLRHRSSSQWPPFVTFLIRFMSRIASVHVDSFRLIFFVLHTSVPVFPNRLADFDVILLVGGKKEEALCLSANTEFRSSMTAT